MIVSKFNPPFTQGDIMRLFSRGSLILATPWTRQPNHRRCNSGLLGFLILVTMAPVCRSQSPSEANALREALTFHASFDQSIDADAAGGDSALWHAPEIEQRAGAKKGLPPGGRVVHEPDTGRFGGALRFTASEGPMVFFRASGNIPMPRKDWSGTVSFWLKTDPANDLREGFCDPIQITSKKWDDAAMFVEFEKRATGIPFRLGVYADHAVWNPTGRKFESIPPAERPLITVQRPPFAADRWVHVAFVFEHFNSDEPNGAVTLFLDGKPMGNLTPRTQTFTWDPNQSAIMLGLGYVGHMDDLAIFHRALTGSEILSIATSNEGIAALTK